jgi:hypothetical protein
MSDDELYQLPDFLNIIKRYFYDKVYPSTCEYKDFTLDIEFKIDSDLSNRKIYIKQARLY